MTHLQTIYVFIHLLIYNFFNEYSTSKIGNRKIFNSIIKIKLPYLNEKIV